MLALAKSDPALFIQRFPAPMLIDEIRYAPELLPYIKMACDERRTSNLFWLTGSPINLMELYRLIWRGSFPAIALREQGDRDLFYSSYIQTYLQRDIRDLARVGDEMAFLRFLRAAAARTGQLLNMADLARDADVAFNTAKNWLSILQTSGVIHLVVIGQDLRQLGKIVEIVLGPHGGFPENQ